MITPLPLRIALAAFLFAWLGTCPQAATPGDSSAVISIDAAASPGPVNRQVFGQNVLAADTRHIYNELYDLNLIRAANGLWDPVLKEPVPLVLKPTREAGVGLLRYPGGSLVHGYDWRKAVGPLDRRGDWKFGIDELMALCHAVGAEPIITVTEYLLPADQLPAHAAGLVEYLNAPATPNHPWAMKRAQAGHPDPYGVKWFELGNESAEGSLKMLTHRQFTPEQYAAYANATASAMRAVDPSIKIGIVMMPGPGVDVECQWNRTVAHLAGKSADFLIIHLYGPEVGKMTPEPDFFNACLAVADQSAQHLDDYRAMALRESGKDLSLAITEYNGTLDKDKWNDRFSYGMAMECADLLRVYLQPEHHVIGANYWEYINGLFGMFRSDGKTLSYEPAFPMYHLWGQHLGTKLTAVQVQGPRVTFAGAGSVDPAEGDAYVPPHPLGPLPTDAQFHAGQLQPGVALDGGKNGEFTVHFAGLDGSQFPTLARFPKPNTPGACDYTVTFEARFVPDPGIAASSLSFIVGDVRGWVVTRSALSIDGIDTGWKSFSEPYHSLADTTAIHLQPHVQGANAKAVGKLEVRNFKIEATAAAQFPAYSLLTACSTLSDDGKTLHLIVFNKSSDQDISAKLPITHFQASSARYWEVNGPGFGAVSGVSEIVHGDAVDLSAPIVTHLFPAHSMTAIDFAAQAAPSHP